MKRKKAIPVLLGILVLGVIAGIVLWEFVFHVVDEPDTLSSEPADSSFSSENTDSSQKSGSVSTGDTADEIPEDSDVTQEWRAAYYQAALTALANPKDYPLTHIKLYMLEEDSPLMVLDYNLEAEVWQYRDGAYLCYEGTANVVGLSATGNLVFREYQKTQSNQYEYTIYELAEGTMIPLAEKKAGDDAWTILADGRVVREDPYTPGDDLAEAGLYTALPWPKQFMVHSLVWATDSYGSENWLASYPRSGDPDPSGILAEMFGLKEYSVDGAPDWLNTIIRAMRQEIFVPYVKTGDTSTTLHSEAIPLYYVEPYTESVPPVIIWMPYYSGQYYCVFGQELVVLDDWAESIVTFYTDHNGNGFFRHDYYGSTTWSRFGEHGFETLVETEAPMGEEENETLVSITVDGVKSEHLLRGDGIYAQLEAMALEALSGMGIGALTELEWIRLDLPAPTCWDDVESVLVDRFVTSK